MIRSPSRTITRDFSPKVRGRSQDAAASAAADPAVSRQRLETRYALGNDLSLSERYRLTAAEHRELGYRVVVKRAAAADCGDPRLAVVIARRLARVRSPFVANVLDIMEDGAGTPAVVLERCDGVSFDEAAGRALIREEDTLVIGLQALAGLEAIHRAGVCHGNLTPRHLLVDLRTGNLPTVRIVGLLRPGSEFAPIETYFSRCLAPEGRSATRFHPSGDLYGLAACLWYGLDLGSSSVRTEAVSARRVEVRAGLRSALRKALSGDISRRYATAGEMAADLLELHTTLRNEPAIADGRRIGSSDRLPLRPELEGKPPPPRATKTISERYAIVEPRSADRPTRRRD